MNKILNSQSQPLLIRLVAIAAILIGAACVAPPTDDRPLDAAEEPNSPMVEQFVWQTDGEMGYRMLRPENWTPLHLGTARGYRYLEEAGSRDSFLLMAINLAVMTIAEDNDSAQVATWLAFEASESFEEWMETREAVWQRFGEQMPEFEFTQIQRWDEAAIYRIILPYQVQFIAYVVDDGMPLLISLEAFGSFADPERIEEQLLVDDFIVMIESAQAIEQDLEHIDPPLAHFSPYTSLEEMGLPAEQRASVMYFISEHVNEIESGLTPLDFLGAKIIPVGYTSSWNTIAELAQDDSLSGLIIHHSAVDAVNFAAIGTWMLEKHLILTGIGIPGKSLAEAVGLRPLFFPSTNAGYPHDFYFHTFYNTVRPFAGGGAGSASESILALGVAGMLQVTQEKINNVEQ